MLYELLSGDTLRGVCHRQLDALRRAYDIATTERVPVDIIVIRFSGTSHVVARLRPLPTLSQRIA